MEKGEAPCCDFCGEPEKEGHVWRLPALSFSYALAIDDGGPRELRSIGDWGACDTCKDLVVNGSARARNVLVARAIGMQRDAATVAVVGSMVTGFFVNWSGSVMPLVPQEGDPDWKSERHPRM